MRRNGSPSANDSPALNRVHRGDCLDLLARMPDASVHLAFADPPFNIGYDYDAYDDRLAADVYLAWSKQWMGEVARVLRSDGTFWLAIGDEYAAELKVIATRELGFTCRSWVVWYYTFGVNCKQKFSRSHAHLFHFVKNPAAFTFNTDAIRVPSARELVYGDKRACPTGRLPDDTWILRPQDLPEGFAADGDTWYFPRVCGTFKERSGWHGCQMPEQLLGRIIRASSRDDDVVLDPFGGSGTTLAVAKKLGRRFIGLELSEQYATRIDDRLAAISPGDPLDGAPEPLKSVPATKDGRRLAKKARRAGKKATLKKAAASRRVLFQKGRSPR
jgi:DNA modification methylase